MKYTDIFSAFEGRVSATRRAGFQLQFEASAYAGRDDDDDGWEGDDDDDDEDDEDDWGDDDEDDE